MLFYVSVCECVCVCVCAKSPRLYPTFCDTIDCSPPGSSVHRILQARILEWLPCPPPGDLTDPGIELAPLKSNLHWQTGSLSLAQPEKATQQQKSSAAKIS